MDPSDEKPPDKNPFLLLIWLCNYKLYTWSHLLFNSSTIKDWIWGKVFSIIPRNDSFLLSNREVRWSFWWKKALSTHYHKMPPGDVIQFKELETFDRVVPFLWSALREILNVPNILLIVWIILLLPGRLEHYDVKCFELYLSIPTKFWQGISFLTPFEMKKVLGFVEFQKFESRRSNKTTQTISFSRSNFINASQWTKCHVVTIDLDLLIYYFITPDHWKKEVVKILPLYYEPIFFNETH